MGSYKDLEAFKKAFALAMEIYEISANLGEAYRRRKYPAHFVSKLTDCDAESTETEIWIQFSFDCKYINEIKFKELSDKSAEVGKLLGYMIMHPDKFC
jgi:four helix bundle protein